MERWKGNKINSRFIFQRHGKGKMVTSYYAYDGEWVNDKREGFGTYLSRRGIQELSDDEDFIPSNYLQGSWTYKYEGNWKADKVNKAQINFFFTTSETWGRSIYNI